MKTYDETIDVVFDRINQHNAAKSRRNAAVKRAAIPVCCLCLAALTGFSILSGIQPAPDPDQTLDDALYPGIDDTIDPDELTGQNPPANTTPDNSSPDHINLIVNPIESLPKSSAMLWALMTDDFVDVSVDQAQDYFGVDIMPDLPEGITHDPTHRTGFYRRGGGTGEIYWDTFSLHFRNADYSRLVHLSIQKKFIFTQFDLFSVLSKSMSTFGNTEVAFCQFPNGDYYAEFMYHDVCFRLSSEGLTQDEFVGVISSLIS